MNDSILVSSIQFHRKIIVIDSINLHKNPLLIKVKQAINTIKEVTIKSHNLTGNLSLDSKAYTNPIPESTTNALDFSNFDLTKPTVNNIDQIDKVKPINANKLTNPHRTDVVNLGALLTPITKKLTKIRSKKRNEIKEEKKLSEAPEVIRKELGDSFFTENLNIPKEKIDHFLIHCKQIGILNDYLNNKKLEFIDKLFKESKNYLNEK